MFHILVPRNDRRSERPISRWGAALACCVLVLATCATLSAGSVADGATSAVKKVPNCSTSDVKEHVSTNKRNYRSGKSVIMTSSLRNVSPTTCNIEVGPTSPSLAVTNVKGAVVWNNCYAKDQPGVCALYLTLHALKSGATYSKSFTWDQRSGSSGTRVPTGEYQLTARFTGVSGNHRTTFYLKR